MKTVFLKELREMLRDKRVRTTAFFGPIFLIFALLTLFGSVLGNIGKPQNIKVTVVANDAPLVRALQAQKFNLQTVGTLEEGRKMVEDGKARVVLDFGAQKDGVTPVTVLYDEKEQLSQIARSAVTEAISQINRSVLDAYIKTNSIPDAAVRPIKIIEKNVGKAKEGGASEFVVGMLPYLIVIWAFYGGMSTASDLAAGEKERNTLETLLITPVPRTQIVLGKLSALASVCLMSSLSSLVGMVVFAALKPSGSAAMFKNGLGVTPEVAGVTLLLLLPLVAFFASLLIAISSFAKNTREAQTYLGLASFVVIMPAMFSQFIGFTDYGSARWINFVPILNSANNIRLALMGKTDYAAVAITVAVSLVLALVMTRITVWLFNREQVLTRI